MTNTEIKKALYKQKPIAHLQMIRKGVAYYESRVKEFEDKDHYITVRFEVPVDDMGDADFFTEMEAKLFSRWIAE